MKIWIDADACPRAVKDILFRAAERLRIPTRLVANKDIPAPASRFVSAIRVADGPDVADRYILEASTPDDIVITADIPLAAHLVHKGVTAINPRGETYDENNIQQRLATRNLMEGLRGAGAVRGGPPAFKATDKQKFANALDRILTRKMQQQETDTP